MNCRQLKIIRKQNGLTQVQVADALGIDRSTYCSYETGRRSIDFNLIGKLSRFYRIKLGQFVEELGSEYVFDDEFETSDTETQYLSQLSKEETDLIVSLRIANEEAKKEILKFAKEKSGRKS